MGKEAMRLRKLLASAAILIALATSASAEPANPAQLKVQLSNIRASIVEKDDKTKHIAHTEADFALVAVSEVELQLQKLAIDGSDNQSAAVDAAIINMRTAVKQFLAAIPSPN
jgi:hypothetical protein